jgi:hypothetical protein
VNKPTPKYINNCRSKHQSESESVSVVDDTINAMALIV